MKATPSCQGHCHYPNRRYELFSQGPLQLPPNWSPLHLHPPPRIYYLHNSPIKKYKSDYNTPLLETFWRLSNVLGINSQLLTMVFTITQKLSPACLAHLLNYHFLTFLRAVGSPRYYLSHIPVHFLHHAHHKMFLHLCCFLFLLEGGHLEGNP